MGNGHAPANAQGANGHAMTAETEDSPNLDPAGDLVERRLDRLFSGMPIEDKSRIAAAYLRGDI